MGSCIPYGLNCEIWHRFNGAATLSLRKYVGHQEIYQYNRASMGPQLYRCGNVEGLTWHTRQSSRFASMGPQLYRCGNGHTSPDFNGAATLSLRKFSDGGLMDCIASMGPQLYRCGNHADARIPGDCAARCFNGAATLSLRKSGRTCRSEKPHQQSRFNGAATLSLRKCTRTPLSCALDGAATLSLRKYVRLRYVTRVLECFNGAATLSLRKWAEGDYTNVNDFELQWGRNFIVAEISCWCNSYCCNLIRFNGAATLSLRK